MLNNISQYTRIQPGATQNIRDNYPIILDFLTAYYEWLETDYDIYTYYVDPINGKDSNSGKAINQAWKTTEHSDIVVLDPGQTIGYNQFGVWVLYRTPGMTANMSDMLIEFMTATPEEFTGKLIIGQTPGLIPTILNLLEQRDVDKSFERFLVYFEKEYLLNIPVDILADPRKLIKHIKDFNLARGSEKSFQLLFRILYNDSVKFYYPKIDIIKPSDGKWTVDTVIRTTTTNDTKEFIARVITGVTSHATAFVENVVQKQISASLVSEIYITNLVGVFDIGETIAVVLPNNTTVNETVYGLVTGATITNPGSGYQPDDIIVITGSNQTGVLAIDFVDGNERGRVVQANSANYPQPASIQLATTASNIDNFYNNTFLTIIDGKGAGQVKKIIDYIGVNRAAILETDWNIIPDVTSHYNIVLGNVHSVKVKDFGIGYTTPIAADFSVAGNGDATGTITVGAVGRYTGRFVDDSGFLSDHKYIQDSFFYQDFSYVLKVHETLVTYKNVVENLLHPASLALFGNYEIDGINLTRKIRPLSGEVITKAFSGALPTRGLIAQYDMIENLLDTQLLFDVSGAYPNGINIDIGSLHSSDINDPLFVPGIGIDCTNTYINGNIIPIDNTAQTIIVVAKSQVMHPVSGVIGTIDNPSDSSVTGFQIAVDVDGSLLFRSQKINSPFVRNDLIAAYPPASINTTDYFFAALRYNNNTLIGNLNQLPSILKTYGSDIDASNFLVNSRGYYMGIGGYHPSLSSPDLYGMGLAGSTIPHVGSVSVPTAIYTGYFDGILSYAIIYNVFLTDTEISNAFQYLKGVMLGRGIAL